MSGEEWKDHGEASDGAELLRGLMDPVDGTEVHIVENVLTKTSFVVYVDPNQTLMEAIANKQLRELDSRAPQPVRTGGKPSASLGARPSSSGPSMSVGEWEDEGVADKGAELLRWLMDPVEGTEVHHVRNRNTGQNLVVYIEPNQTLTDAVANGQFRERSAAE